MSTYCTMEVKMWRDEDWIGRGLSYSTYEDKEVVQKQKNLLFHIPDSFDHVRPTPGLSMQALLCIMDRVTEGRAMPMLHGGDLISADEPNTGLEKLFEALILPPVTILQQMYNAFGQAWFDGRAKSIIEFTDLKKGTRYPLPALEIYREFARANAARCEWARAEEWMTRGKRVPGLSEVIQLSQKLMFAFEWDAEVRALHATVPGMDLLRMLDTSWLNDSQIDMLMQVLTDRERRTQKGPTVIFAPVVFQQFVEELYEHRNDEKHRNIPFLEHYKEEFSSGMTRGLYLIGHVNGNHWVPWIFDYEKCIVGHGDSLNLGEDAMRPLANALLWWFSRFRPCTYRASILAHGNQMDDSYNCGIIAYNAIAHDVYGDEIWTMQSRKRLRIEAFNDIVLWHNGQGGNHSARRRGLQIPLDSYRVADPLSCALLDESELHRRGLQVPLDSQRVANSPSCALQNEREPDIEMEDIVYTPDYDGTAATMPALSSCPELSKSSLEAGPMHENDQYTLTKNLAGPSGREPSFKRGSSDHELKRPDDEEKPKRIRRNIQKGPLDVLFGRVVQSGQDEYGSWEDTEIEREPAYGNLRGPPASHELIVGVSKSAQHSQKVREACLSGTLTIKDALLDNFKAKIFVLDPHAEFKPKELRVRHSKCRRWVKMRGAYSVTNFEIHLPRCKGKNTLHMYLKSSSMPQRLPNKPPYREVPCSGLSASHDHRIGMYLLRPSALGGGGKSKVVIAKERFRKSYRELTKRYKKEVDQLHEETWKWVIKHNYNAVHSSSCAKSVHIKATDNEEEDEAHACGPCLSLLRDKHFRMAISVPEPLPSNIKHANKAYQYEELGIKLAKCKGIDELLRPKNKEVRMAVSYAQGVSEGKFAEHEVFTGLVNSFLQRLDREGRGKKLTNFKYPPAFDEFISTVFLVCPQAHRLLADHFPVRSSRSIRRVRAKEPQFTPGISPRSFELADKFLTALNVPHRHVALSADDTKLLDTLAPFFDRESEAWYIVGGAGDPLLINDFDNLQEELEHAKLKKATKVRVWTVIVPLPKIPPLVLAAMAITEDVTADELTEYTTKIIDGLHERDIWPVSYACDGTEKERLNQRNLRARAHGEDTRVFPAPSPLVKELKISIPIYHGRPIAMIQDSLHARKTGRNNIESGARTLVLGNHCVLYGDLREMAFDDKSPLYHRDVEKSDKQDDRAAARVSSSRVIEWLIENRPGNLGLIIFLFIFGELIDTFQSRSASFFERFRMFFRSYYFIELWESILVDSNYSLNTYGLSREARDIFSILGQGFLQLVIIYRDYFSVEKMPLLLWLHSSEVCEHVFAELRKHVKDFNFAEFLLYMPKTHWTIRYGMGLGGMATSDAKTRAAGYAHTWMDLDDLSLSNLRVFPNDNEIVELAKEGFEDAQDLWQQLGVFFGDLHKIKHNPSSKEDISDNEDVSDEEDKQDDENRDEECRPKPIPPLSQWLPEPDALDRYVEGAEQQGIFDTSRAVLEKIFVREQEICKDGSFRPRAVEDTMLNISCAKLLLDFDTSLRIDEELPTPTPQEVDEFWAEYSREVGKCLANNLPPIVDRLNVTSEDGDIRLPLKTLLELRRAHETRFAKKAVRTATTNEVSDAQASEIQDSRARHSLIKKVSQVLKLQQDVGKGTGLERKARWTSGQVMGNAANAAATAATRAAQTMTRRREILSRFNFSSIMLSRLSNASLGATNPLRKDSFGVVYLEQLLLVCRVQSIYSKSGGKNSRHNWVEEASNIGQVSNLSLQTLEYAGNRVFREVVSTRAHLHVRSFAHIRSFQFLFAFRDVPLVLREQHSIKLTEESFKVWKEIQGHSNILSLVMKEFRKRS